MCIRVVLDFINSSGPRRSSVSSATSPYLPNRLPPYPPPPQRQISVAFLPYHSPIRCAQHQTPLCVFPECVRAFANPFYLVFRVPRLSAQSRKGSATSWGEVCGLCPYPRVFLSPFLLPITKQGQSQSCDRQTTFLNGKYYQGVQHSCKTSMGRYVS